MSPTQEAVRAVSTPELAKFTRQLGAMLDTGVDVLRALRVSGQLTGNPRLLEATREVGERLEDGREFHRAITACPDLFDAFYVEMARQGERDSQLGKALLSLADYLERTSAPSEMPVPIATTVHSGPSAAVTGLTMTTLGVMAVGAGVVWGVSAASLLPVEWTGPIAVLWSGACLLAGGWLLGRIREPQPEETASLETPAVEPEPRPEPKPEPASSPTPSEPAGRPRLVLEKGGAPKRPGQNGKNGKSPRPVAEEGDDRLHL